jgi:broad specificity phosphatase PhoE
MTPEYGSHLPVLLRLVDVTDGPILELGMGLWSTPILDLLCRRAKREIWSYDNDAKWFSENKKWESDYHHVEFVKDWSTIIRPLHHWSVVLIDHRPAIRRRVDAVLLADLADFIVIHDTEPEIDRFYRFSSIWKHFSYRYDYLKIRPATTVVSNTKDPAIYFTR